MKLSLDFVAFELFFSFFSFYIDLDTGFRSSFIKWSRKVTSFLKTFYLIPENILGTWKIYLIILILLPFQVN